MKHLCVLHIGSIDEAAQQWMMQHRPRDDDGESPRAVATHEAGAPPHEIHSATARAAGGGLINSTSVHGSRLVEYMTAYAASKAALESLTRGLACEYAPDGVRVNAIAPGVVPVERTAAAFSDAKVVDMWTPCIPVGRLGTAEDVAHAALLLATNEWMTGTVLTVDGRMMACANMLIRPRPPAPSPHRPGRPGGGCGGGGSLGARLSSPEIIFEVPCIV